MAKIEIPMAKIELPELTQILGQLSNTSVVLVDEVRTAVQLSTGLLQNITMAMSETIKELSSAIKGVNSVVPGAISNTTGSVQRSIDLNSPAVHFALTALGIFFIVSTLFILACTVYKCLEIVKYVVNWCKEPSATTIQGNPDVNQILLLGNENENQ